jgi:energy-coupling factor transporter ATP-binding protein EcfA2
MPDDPSAFRLHSAVITNFLGIRRLELSFEPDVTVIAGPNGIGKSSVLRLLRDFLTQHGRVIVGLPRSHPQIDLKYSGTLSPTHSDYSGTVVFLDEERRRGIPDFSAWWDQRDIAHARVVRKTLDPNYRDPQLAVFEDALANAGMVAGRIVGFPGEQLHVSRDGAIIQWAALSSGEQAIITMIGMIARYAGEQAGADSTASSSAFLVLIDEIELHLHPRWQRQILPVLRQAFPACQFVVTTHSPQVVGSVEARSVRLISKDTAGLHRVIVPHASRGMDTNFILEALMEADDRDPVVSDAIDRFLETLQLRNFPEAERALEAIRSGIEDESDPIVARLNFQLSLAKARVSE